jgi:lysophospholipase L1-like esterase
MTVTGNLYLALGDSMSIDLYPDLDAAEKLGRPIRGLGAASLLHRNNDDRWPEFRGRDLITAGSVTSYRNVAVDGAMIDNVASVQFRTVMSTPRVITLSVGGNDLLSAYATSAGGARLRESVQAIKRQYTDLLSDIHQRWPESLVILTTVYDPTDGTGDLGNGWKNLPMHFLAEFNDRVRELGNALDRLEVADAHAHFMGHGITARGEDRWYWPHSVIEPSSRGASELRRLWLSIIERTYP